MTTSDGAAASRTGSSDYSSEVRFGVVMYGGVSLAIYINGVANEMYEMVCATPKDGPDSEEMEGTREIYRRLSWLADNPSLRKEYHDLIKASRTVNRNGAPKDVWKTGLRIDRDLHPVRFVLDVISGTSAGGINGIFLAKALANGEPFRPLQDLWVQEGDIDLLLNDSHSYRDLTAVRNRAAHPESLLNGDRMYLRLFRAMESMRDDLPASGGKPLVDEIDLFVTTTDIAGSPVPLRLSRQTVYERRHKQNFHFRLSQTPYTNHFEKNNNGLLAFAARCTSSFPFAFEPMTLAAVKRLKPELAHDIDTKWPAYFAYLPQHEVSEKRHVFRAFGDGGYLDNKPFTYVAQTLAIRQAVVPVERKLVYIEPAPEKIDPNESPDDETQIPDALANSLAALAGIPRYETIREDLQEVLKRNRSIERVDRIVREGEQDLHLALYEAGRNAAGKDAEGFVNPFIRIIKEGKGEVPPWPQFTRSKMVRYYGTAILAYRRLRVSAVTDSLGRRLAELWGVDPESDHLYALTALIRAWRDDHYREERADDKCMTINMFLDEFDVEYRIRKLSFLLQQIDHLRRLVRKCREGFLKPEEYDLLPASDRLSIQRLKNAGWRLLDKDMSSTALSNAFRALHVLKMQLNDAQRKWRIMALTRGQTAIQDHPIGEQLRWELNCLLSMLLGERPDASLQVRTVSGNVTGVRLSEATLKAASRARTLQESVVERAKGLFRAARTAERTCIQDALESSLESLRRAKIQPGIGDILGSPRLRLEPPFDEVSEKAWGWPPSDNERVEVDVDELGNPILDTKEGAILRRLLGEYYLYFDLFDQMSFPLYHDAGIGEPSIVEVTRISPQDATNLIDESRDTRRKLAGTALANFGAFIDRNWRLNDIMWGRLDGAERLIRTLLPMQDPVTNVVRDELIHLAQSRILRESLVPEGTGKLTKLLCKALAEMRLHGDTQQQVRNLLDRVLPGQSHLQHQHLASVLVSFVDEHVLLDYVRKTYQLDRQVNAKEMLRNVSRATTITGRMLEGISKRQRASPFVFRWLARGGLILQGLIAVSMPGTIQTLWRSHVMNVLYLIGAVLAILALATNTGAIFSFAIKMLVITAAVHLVTYVLADIMRSRAGLYKKGLLSGLVVMAILAVVGGISLYSTLHSWANGDSLSVMNDMFHRFGLHQR